MVLQGIRKHLKPRGLIVCTEVFNHSLFLEPYAPHFLKYWREFNNLQWEISGHPHVGISLGNLLKQAGYHDICVQPVPLYFDSRQSKQRAEFSDYFLNILLSAQERLVGSGRVTAEDVQSMKSEFAKVKKTKTGVFYYSFIRATAKA